MSQSLIDQLRSPNPAQRKQAIVALAKTGDHRVLQSLAEVYRTDPVPELRELALKAGRYIQQLQPAQDVLGDYNDEGVAAGTFRNAAAHDARAWFAVGWLGARQPVLARDCAKALLAIGKARRFWK